MANVNVLKSLCKYRSRRNKSLILLLLLLLLLLIIIIIISIIIIIIIFIIIKRGRRQVKEKLGLVEERYSRSPCSILEDL